MELANLRKDLENFRKEAATKVELASLRKDLENLRKDLGNFVANIGSVFATKADVANAVAAAERRLMIAMIAVAGVLFAALRLTQ